MPPAAQRSAPDTVLVRVPPTPGHQHFFRMTCVQFRRDYGTPPCSASNRDGVPWFTRTKTIEISGLEINRHLWRRNDDHAYITLHIDACGSQPGAQQKVMRRT